MVSCVSAQRTRRSEQGKPAAMVISFSFGSRLDLGWNSERGFGGLIIADPLWKRKLTHYRKTLSFRIGRQPGEKPASPATITTHLGTAAPSASSGQALGCPDAPKSVYLRYRQLLPRPRHLIS